MNTFLTVQVQFNAGVIKTFLAPKDILMDDFIIAVRRYGGRFRSMRFQPDTPAEMAGILVRSGNYIVLEARRVEA